MTSAFAPLDPHIKPLRNKLEYGAGQISEVFDSIWGRIKVSEPQTYLVGEQVMNQIPADFDLSTVKRMLMVFGVMRTIFRFELAPVILSDIHTVRCLGN